MAVINVMAPLVVGDHSAPDDNLSSGAWQKFAEDLRAAKLAGVTSVSTDIWWGLVEKFEGKYTWRYYEKLSDYIIAAGLKWMPIISLHKCGGNVGDDVTVKLPKWVWRKLAKLMPQGNAIAAKYVSEQGNVSNEFVSCWATDLILPDYIRFFAEFQTKFAAKAQHIAEINISLGPAGELRFTSYNAHDEDTDYPTRGALQCYSDLARRHFRQWCVAKYGSIKALQAAWGTQRRIEPPRDVEAFFQEKVHTTTQYGKDFFDWYQDSLLEHARKVMTAAIKTFSAEGAAFRGIDVGAKVPGVHWYMGYRDGEKRVIGERLAELAAGLLRTSSVADWESDEAGRGYRPIVTLFKELAAVNPATRVVLHFTCLEMSDPVDQKSNEGVNSLAQSLVCWVGKEALKQGVPIKGENALSGSLKQPECWVCLRSALALVGNDGSYEALTLLRVTDAVATEATRQELRTTCQSQSRTASALSSASTKEEDSSAAA